jgi:maltose alpha-D-glucosyltransferase/alpha-amylase
MPFVIQEKGARSRQRERYGYLREMREFCQWRVGDSVLLAEANVLPTEDADYFGDGDRVHMMFNFQVNQNLFLALATEDARPLAKALTGTAAMPPSAQWAHFLRNNDELDLGRLSKADQARVFAAFAPEKTMQLYQRGIRRRLAPMLKGDRSRLELAYSLMFGLPGTPVLRYGDEIGMGDDLSLPERSAARTPMQWSSEKNGGFSLADKTVLPAIDGGPFGFQTVNVADQRRHPDSLLNWTERMIRMRKQCPEIGWGHFRLLRTGATPVLGLRYEWRGNALVLLHNLGTAPATVRLELGDEGDQLLTHLLDDNHVTPKNGRHVIELEGSGYRWYRVGRLTDLLHRGVEGSAPDSSSEDTHRRGRPPAPARRTARRRPRT